MAFWDFQKSEKDKYLAEAKRLRRRGEFDRAGDFYFMAGAEDEAMQAYVEGGHFQQAAQMVEKKGDLRRAADLYVQARDLRAAAQLYHRVGDGKRASQMFEKLGEHFKAAQIEEELGAHHRAGELYERSGHHDRASLNYAKEGDFAQAAEALEAHLKRKGTLGKPGEREWAHCADLYKRAKRGRKAAEIWARIGDHRHAAEAFEAWGDLARAVEQWLKAGDSDRAFAVFQRAPDGSVDRAVVAQLQYERGNWREAGDIFRELGDAQRAAECYEKTDDKELAAAQYEQAGDLEVAADMLYAAGKYGRASELYERGLRYRMAARAADECGEAERAARLYEQAHESVEAARCWNKLGQAERAIELLQKMTPAQEGYTEAAILLGELFRAKGLHTIAAEKFRSAISGQAVEPGTIDAYYGLSQIHEDKIETAKAIEILEHIVAVNYSYRDAAERLERLRKSAQSNSGPSRLVPAPGLAQPAAETQALPSDAAAAAGATSGVFGRRYEIIGRASTGPRGDTYKAWDQSLGRTVLLKRLVPVEHIDEGEVARYLREAQSASKLHHSNIAAIYDAVDAPDGRFIATEYVFGESLRDVLLRETKLSPARTIEILAQVLLALECAHDHNVTHRNLRPENVLLAEKTHVKITDFGMSRRASDLKASGSNGMSPLEYLSPEQLRGEKADPRTDLYAVGCMAFEMLIGEPPFRGPDTEARQLSEEPRRPSTLVPEIPESLEKFVLACLQKDPARRYASARQAHDELRSQDFIPGQRIAERYELLREIGSGGMGKVFLARDLELDERLAMKVLRPEFGTDSNLEQRFIREIKLARRIVHPSVVKVYDFGKWKNVKYITMEYIDGISLDEYVRRSKPPNIREVCRFVVQICEALDAAHRLGVVHRDIKPQNVLISSDRRAKLVDFGIARIEEYEDLTSSRLIIGSPKYMSPEQISGKNIDHRTDVYSLGVVMYYCVTGIEPFTAEDTNGIIMKQLNQMPVPPSQVNAEVPPWLEMVILKCLVKDPQGRYQRAIDVSRDILARLR